jgi:hypothetical protein
LTATPAATATPQHADIYFVPGKMTVAVVPMSWERLNTISGTPASLCHTDTKIHRDRVRKNTECMTKLLAVTCST